jgi:hypothetical protein
MDVNDPAVAVHDPAMATLGDPDGPAHLAWSTSDRTMARRLRAPRER